MPSIPLAPLPQHLETVQTWTLDSVSELGRLRRELSQALLESHPEHAAAHGELTEGMVLVCSELATNAIKHGRPPTVVRLLSDGVYVLDVMDHDPVSIPAIARGRGAGEGGLRAGPHRHARGPGRLVLGGRDQAHLGVVPGRRATRRRLRRLTQQPPRARVRPPVPTPATPSPLTGPQPRGRGDLHSRTVSHPSREARCPAGVTPGCPLDVPG